MSLDKFVDLVPAVATRKPLPPAASNVLLLSATPPDRIQHGALKDDDAGPADGAGTHDRVVALLGPGATFEGLAALLLPRYEGLAGHPAPKPDDLAKALVVYGRALWPDHRVGLCLPLPIEVDQATRTWTVDADRIGAWAKLFDKDWKKRLSTPPAPLAVPGPAQIEGDAATARRLPASLARFQWQAVLRNPFEAVLTFVTVVRQLRDDGPTGPKQQMDFALGVLGLAQRHHVEMLAATTAGNAILRSLDRVLKPDPPLPGTDPGKLAAARTLVTNALFKDPAARRDLVPHHEVPLTAGLMDVRTKGATAKPGDKADPAGGLHRLVLGRDVAAGRDEEVVAKATGKKHVGPAFKGRLVLDQFLAEDAQGLNPGRAADREGRLALLSAYGVGGGLLDAVAVGGDDVLTIGVGAFSAADPKGLPEVLHRLKVLAPEEFDLYFALHRLDVEPDPFDVTKFQLKEIPTTGGPPTPLNTTDKLIAFFKGAPGPGGKVRFGPEWAARFRLAALVSRKYRRQQVLQALPKLKVDPIELAIAAVGPFPAAYRLDLDDGVPSRDLGGAVAGGMSSLLTALRGAGVSSADSLSGAVVDLTGGPPKPAYASSNGADDEDMFYVGSMGKVPALYAALELRTRLRKAVAAAVAVVPKGLDVSKAGWETGFLKMVRNTWAGRVARGFPGLDTGPGRLPKPEKMFTFSVGGGIDFTKGTATTAQIAALNLDPPTPNMKFREMLTSMTLMSNAHAAAVVIDAVGFPYLNGLMREAGFFDPGSKKGLWVSGNYRGGDWKEKVDLMDLSARGTTHYKSTTNFAGNARQFARLLTLLETTKLFDGDAGARTDMKELMRKHGYPHPVDNSFIQDAVDAMPRVPPAHVDEVYSKIGIGEPLTPGGLKIAGDCAIIVRKEGPHTLRYVAVGVGGYTRAPHGGAFLKFAMVLDLATAAQHP